MQRLGRMPRANAYSPVFLPLSYIYSFRLSKAGYSKVITPGNYLSNHVMYMSHAMCVSHNLPAGSIKIAITAALLLILSSE